VNLAVLKAHDWHSWSARHARGEVAGELGPYGAEQLRSHGISLHWSDSSHRPPWNSPLLMRPLRKLGTMRPQLIGAREALVSARSVKGADATLALFEDQALAAAYARTKGVAPFAGRPLAIIACWLAENCTDFDAETRVAYRQALMGADRVCFFSQNQTEILERELDLPAERLRCVPFGIDAEFFSTDGQAGEQTDAGYILAIGRDIGRDHNTLLEAVRGTELPVRLVTPQPELAALAPPNVELIQTTVEHPEYRALLAGASVVAVPTHAPAYPSGQTVVLEAMAMGKAIVTTDSPAMRDYVQDGHTGMLVPAHDARALSEALKALMTDAQLRQTLGDAAREQVHQRFNHRTMWAALADVLSELVPQAG
jgi:glycosyltransferase involved in cell wall biosynthesis